MIGTALVRGRQQPCSWRIEGHTEGPATWEVTAYGDMGVSAGDRVEVTVPSPLGLLRGQAHVRSVQRRGDQVLCTYMTGDGPLVVIP